MSMRRLAVRQLLQLSDALLNTTQESSTATRALAAQLSSLAADLDAPLVAQPRQESGSSAAARLRRSGRIPGTLFSLPGEESLLLSFDRKDIATRLQKLGRTGWACQIFNVQVAPGPDADAATEPMTFPALGRQVHMTAATDEIENVTLMYCPPDRKVRVQVPLRVFGEESSPGLKAGGRINWIERTIPCVAPGGSVPAKFEVSVAGMAVNDKLAFTDLEVPQGVTLAVRDVTAPIIKIMKK